MYIVAGIFRNRKLNAPKGENTRPTASHLRETLFNICQTYVEDSRFLDLFAGSGAVGLEAISRGAKSSTFVENHKDAIRCIQQNIKSLAVENQCILHSGDVFKVLERLELNKNQFDIIFADPPYHVHTKIPEIPFSEKIIRWIDENNLLVSGGTLFIEEAFEHQPQISDLKTLKLKNSRRVSSAILQQYVRC
ncbi:MAG: 16S rRNA (guanine(966)-N(2))-methyltransferase RsmD [Parachlamydiaceae bacterium]|nr:16S rRNA (guanine(966)-N(2))-methyltransferase RsmD [Parachlamydiaceae bacterium]